MGRFFLILLLGAGVVVGYGYLNGWFPSDQPLDGSENNTQGGDGPTQTATKPVPDDLGESLYAPQPLAKLPVIEGAGRDPVVIPGVFDSVTKSEISPPMGGKILFIGTEVPEGVLQVGGIAPFFQDDFQYATINQGGRDIFKMFKPLLEGQKVGEGQMLVQIDPSKATNNRREKSVKVAAAVAEREAAQKIEIVAMQFLKTDQQLYQNKTIAERQYRESELTHTKTRAELISKMEGVKAAEIELNSAEIIFNEHQLINRINVTYSIIRSVIKNAGDGVKDFEPIMHLQSPYKLMAVGFVEAERDIQKGAKVRLEPILDLAPDRSLRTHAGEITCVAIDQENRFLTGSIDREVHVWNRGSSQPIFVLRHTHAVRSIACSPLGSKDNWCVVGASDGEFTVWELGKDSFKALAKFKLHSDGVTALAFSPDGQYFASGGGDGKIVLFEKTDSGPKLKYALSDSPHTGVITSLHFTPQARLVSASRDLTLRVWKLQKNGARLDKIGNEDWIIGGRTGTVPQIGVSADGRWILREQGKSLQFIDGESGNTIMTMQNPSDAVPFETLATFSPVNRSKPGSAMMLTAGASEGRLQLWQAPENASKRGFEIRQFVTKERSSVTSAAFAWPDASGEIPFAISGTKDGVVYVWSVPPTSEIQSQRIENCVVKKISPNVDNRQVQIGVEITNADGKLTPGRPVTIVILPEAR